MKLENCFRNSIGLWTRLCRCKHFLVLCKVIHWILEFIRSLDLFNVLRRCAYKHDIVKWQMASSRNPGNVAGIRRSLRRRPKMLVLFCCATKQRIIHVLQCVQQRFCFRWCFVLVTPKFIHVHHKNAIYGFYYPNNISSHSESKSTGVQVVKLE